MFLIKALAIWLVIIFVESIHGVLRSILLAPLVGDFQARQISVFIGSLLILTVAYFSVRWIRATNVASLIIVGLAWLVLTLLFELSLGRFILELSWERIASDYDIRHGGLLPIGLVFLTLSHLIAARWRGFKSSGNEQLR